MLVVKNRSSLRLYIIKDTSSHVVNNYCNLYEIDCRKYNILVLTSHIIVLYYTHIWCVLDLATSPTETIFFWTLKINS